MVFPTMNGGGVLIHNYSVWHAVAPIEAGTRYSFLIFYDRLPSLTIEFYHEIEDVAIDLVYVDQTEENVENRLIMVREAMAPFESLRIDSYEGHVFRALLSGTETVIAEFVMRDEQRRYKIEHIIGGEDSSG